MDLVCYTFPNWAPRIRPASARRDWMDATPESFAYRCLPLGIANAHGWEILSPCGFEAEWNGGASTDDVVVSIDPGTTHSIVPVSLFGQGTITFHVEGLLRTAPGWDLWVGGAPNHHKDGIAPLAAVVETDWSPYSFTMNWRFTRPGHAIRFEEDEPFCFFFPIERRSVAQVSPIMRPIDDDPALKIQYEAWSRSRDAFHAHVAAHPPEKPADKWQKLYYRGVDPDGRPGVADHRSKLRLPDFRQRAIDTDDPPPRCPARSAIPDQALRKRDWVMQTQSRLRALSPAANGIFRHEHLAPGTFLDQFYACNRPVVLGGVAREWVAHRRWTPGYLQRLIGGAPVEVQANRSANTRFERDKDTHCQTMAFASFIDACTGAGAINDVYMTAYNAAANITALAPLYAELGTIEGILDHTNGAFGMPWIGPAGTFTPLHHDLTNNLLVQVTGRKRVILAAPGETGRLYNDHHVFSEIADLTGPDLDLARYPLLEGITFHDITLEPGDALFIPVGWWHQVRSLDFSISVTYTNFVWPNDAHLTYPAST